MSRDITIKFLATQDEAARIDQRAEESGLDRSTYLRMTALQRRNKFTVSAPLTDYTFLSSISALTDSIVDSTRRGEDAILDLLELKEQIDKRLAACFEK